MTLTAHRSSILRSGLVLSLIGAASLSSFVGCSSSDPDDGALGDTSSGGGDSLTSSGGALGSGGTFGSGGNLNSGGTFGSGGNLSSGGSGGDAASGGAVGVGGSEGAGGAGNTGGADGAGGSDGTGGDDGMDDCTSTDAADNFSFFVTSMHHILELSGSEDGFGGDLRYNGAATGLEGADALCQEMARRVCHGDKTWKAFLSTSQEDAIDRIGSGPWYDHAGVLVASDVSGLAGNERPAGGCCDTGTFDELGVRHDGQEYDDHDTLTGSNTEGRLDSSSSTCDDWTSTTAEGQPRLGHSWPRSQSSGREWIMDHNAGGCAAGVNVALGGSNGGPAVGSSGGYGGFYCFAL